MPPLIRLDSFWAEYDGEQALAAAFLDELQGERIDCLYSDVRTESYSFRLDKGEFLCSILVRGEKAWLLWGLAPEAEYSISGLMSEKLIRWSGALDEVGFGEKLRSYAVAEPEPDIRLVFCMCQEAEGEKNRNLHLYRYGDYENPWQEFGEASLPDASDFRDIDRDGILELRLTFSSSGFYYRYYHWDQENRRYEPIEVSWEEWHELAEEEELKAVDGAGGDWLIPQGLLDRIGRAFQEGTEYEVLKAMTDYRVLDKEEVKAIGKESLGIRQELAMTRGRCAVIEADLDNDGISDLFMETVEGGSGGFTRTAFFKGGENGTYERTDTDRHILEEFAVISYGGKNYYCRRSYDYGVKLHNGVDLYCYENGELAEKAAVRITAADYRVEIEECPEERWRSLAEQIASASADYRERIHEGEILLGGAEQKETREEEDYYLCDLDNDGEQEEYTKIIWGSSSLGSEDYLAFSCEENELIEDAVWAGEGTPMMLWAEEAEGTEIERLYRITGTAEYGTEQMRYR